MSSTYAPFVFDKAAALDQRCNFVRPKAKVDWRTLGALLTSSFFSLSAECAGASSMGAGALELATKKLPSFRILDLRVLSDDEREDLAVLVEDLWKNEAPVDWASKEPGPKLRALDSWFVGRLSKPIALDKLYAAIKETCKSRLAMAEGKKAVSKQHVRVDINTVAAGISEHVRPLVEARPFPEAFFDLKSEMQSFDLTKHNRLEVACIPMMGNAVLTVANGSDTPIISAEYDRAVAQVIVKALLLGRRKFSVPLDDEAAGQALSAVGEWLGTIMDEVNKGLRMSAVGTKYEAEVLQQVLLQLAIHPRAEESEIFGEVTVGAISE